MPILPKKTISITTPRLLIRPPQIGDVKVLHEAIVESYPQLQQFLDWAKTMPSIDEAREHIIDSIKNWVDLINDEPYLPLFIFDKHTNEFIGVAGFHHYNWDIPSIETGYWIKTSCSNKGLMLEAINAHTRYAIDALGMKRIAITCDVNNIRSKNIPEKLHYTLEGRLKNHRRNPVTNALSDTLVYAKYDCDNLPKLAVAW